ncbi:hypothetical protein F2Q68_00012224 [Brassica cretica]|uniref:Uncharacterized protein n=1 Tax=Brassica cretica TaxID=69181 RepID=A0A8S9KRC0_BRACR|nr:hypothetical protein F2Q68_00012224 [Brassica cretica]
MKNGGMMQSKKLLEDIAGIAGNCLKVCPSQEGKNRLHLWIRTCGVLDIWSHHRGILRQCPQESPLANGQILIDGQLVRRAKAYHGFDGFGVTSRFYYSMRVSPGLCRKSVQQELKDFDSRLNAHEWNRKAKEEINLQKDVQVSVQALEHVRDFDSKLGSQLKTIDEGDGYSEWQWDCHIPFIRRDVYIMKEFQAWLKVELREVRRDKRRQGDAEDEQACSIIKRCQHKVRVMDLDQTGQVLIQRRRDHDMDLQAQAEPLGGGSFHGVSWRDRGLYTHDRESNDLVNHIGCVFRYFIVDVVDPGSTSDVARCGSELGEQFLSHEQG